MGTRLGGEITKNPSSHHKRSWSNLAVTGLRAALGRAPQAKKEKKKKKKEEETVTAASPGAGGRTLQLSRGGALVGLGGLPNCDLFLHSLSGELLRPERVE